MLRVFRLVLGVRWSTEKLVLLKLGESASPDGRNAWPAVRTIAQQCDLSTRAVQRALKRLLSRGLIRVQSPATLSRPTTYHVLPDATVERLLSRASNDLTPGDSMTGGDGLTPGVSVTGDDSVTPPGCQSVAEGDDSLAPDPSKRDPSLIRQREHGDESAVATLPSVDDEIDSSEVLGDDEDRREKTGVVADHKAAADVRRLLQLYHDVCVGWPVTTILTEKLRRHCKARLRERPVVEQWRPIFERALSSPFLRGERTDFRGDFEWFVKNADNVRKLLEGKYDDRQVKPQTNGYRPRVVTSADFEATSTWSAIVDAVLPTLTDDRERMYFEQGASVIAESPRQLVVASAFTKRLTGEYAERLQTAAAKVRPGLVVNVQAQVEEVV